jgi:hypothetical protein
MKPTQLYERRMAVTGGEAFAMDGETPERSGAYDISALEGERGMAFRSPNVLWCSNGTPDPLP